MRTLSIAIVASACIAAWPAIAQEADATPDAARAGPPAVSGDETGAIRPSELAPGANSFTEGQARSRIESAGFTAIGPLKQDAQGIWRGMANRGAARVSVGLDFRGNVAADVTKAE